MGEYIVGSPQLYHTYVLTLGGNFPSSISKRSPDFKCSLCSSALYKHNEAHECTNVDHCIEQSCRKNAGKKRNDEGSLHVVA